MKKSEKLLEAIGAIDERHLPDPNEIFNIQSGEDVGEEAELRFSGDYREKRLPLRAVLIPALLTAAAVAVGIALKNYPLPTDPDYTFEVTSSLTEEDERTQPSGTTAGTLFEETELAPLDLIGCYIDEEGHYRIDIENWQKSDDFDLYRKYFFGTWESTDTAFDAPFGKNVPPYVIDDSEKTFFIGWRFNGFYKLSENVLAFAINSNAERVIFWIDINYPDIMYMDYCSGGWLPEYDYTENWKPNILTKTDVPINEPEENFLSIFKLYEMSRDYGIDFDMLVNIEYETDIYIGDDSYFVTHDGMVWARLLHDDWYQFYPVYLVSEAPDKLEFKTRIGNIVYDNSEIDAEYTIVKINGKWSRDVKLTLSDGSTVTLSDDNAPHPNETDLSALELLDYYIDEEGHYRANDTGWKLSDDYELFRKYFFGEWEGSFVFADDSSKQERMIIDDSLKSYNMTESGIFLSQYYEVNSHVLAFITGGIEGSSIQWIDTDHPDTMYMVWGGLGENNWLWSRDDDGRMSSPKVYTLTKTDALPNEPEDGFLSIFRLREISRNYGIGIDMLLDIEYQTNIFIGDDPDFVTQDGMVWAFLAHNQSFQFYPVYLVSEAPDKLEFKTRIGNGMYKRPEDFEADAEYTIQKINGEWKRTVILTLSDGTTVNLETADTEKEQPDDQESDTVTDPPAAEGNESSELIVHKYNIDSGSHKDGYFPVEYNGIVYDYDFVNGSYIIDADNNITHRGTYGEEQLNPEYELDALLMNFEELEYLGKVDMKALHWSSEPDMEYADLYKHGDNLIFIFNFFIPTQEVLFCQGYFGFKFTLEEDQRMKEDRSSIKDILAEHGIDPSIFYDAVMFTKGELRHSYEYEEVYSIIKE